ncbi:MAG TPA: 30S ribosome-binding factor RbfA [Stellaceae bacterium]|nr:30S ribosome-binding factor RbfA [Stellaceae bacterium]
MATHTPGQRSLRVGEELRHALARIFERGELRDPALADATVTVTEVRVTPDLKSATAFVVPLGGSNGAEIMAALGRSAPFLRRALAHEVRLRHAPALAFALDTSFDYASRIDALLRTPAVKRDLAAPEPPESEDGGDGA